MSEESHSPPPQSESLQTSDEKIDSVAAGDSFSGIESLDPSSTDAPPAKGRRAILVSLIVHLVLLAGLAAWYVPRFATQSKRSSQATNADSLSSSQKSASTAPPASPANEPADVPADQIQKSVESQIESAEQLSDSQKRSELERNLRRLESIANPNSVADTSRSVADAVGVDTQQYAPGKQPAEGEFDTDTAQLADVIRERTPSGNWKYQSRMVDAEGREMLVPMNAADGESVYETFQTMKQFPMAEGIYRGVVMPMLQKIMETQDAAARIQPPSATNPSLDPPLDPPNSRAPTAGDYPAADETLLDD